MAGLRVDEYCEVVEEGVADGKVGLEAADDGEPRCRCGLRVCMVDWWIDSVGPQ